MPADAFADPKERVEKIQKVLERVASRFDVLVPNALTNDTQILPHYSHDWHLDTARLLSGNNLIFEMGLQIEFTFLFDGLLCFLFGSQGQYLLLLLLARAPSANDPFLGCPSAASAGEGGQSSLQLSKVSLGVEDVDFTRTLSPPAGQRILVDLVLS